VGVVIEVGAAEWQRRWKLSDSEGGSRVGNNSGDKVKQENVKYREQRVRPRAKKIG